MADPNGNTVTFLAPDSEGSTAYGDATPELAQDARLRIFVLGSFRIEGPGGILANDGWHRRKARQLFKWLVTRPSRCLPRDEAYALFWPNSDAAPSSLRVVLHALRKALAGVGVARPDELVQLDSDGVVLNRDHAGLDADAFERLVPPLDDASDDDLEAAARLYAGQFLADDLYESWTAAPRDHLRRLWCDLLLELSQRRERRGEIELAAAALRRRFGADACDELAGVELMALWLRHGRRSDALRTYQRLADALRRELGVEPGADALRLRDSILSADIGRPSSKPSPPASVGPESNDLLLPPPVAPSVVPAGPATPPFEPSYPFPLPASLAGRQHELQTLSRMVERGRAGGQTVLIGGPAGVGKSTLAGAVVREARERGFVCLVGRSFEQDNPIPLGSIRDALSDYLLAREPEQLWAEFGSVVGDLELIVPALRSHLNLPRAAIGRQLESGQLLSLLHSCLRALAVRQPVLLCLEDLHAADDATIAALPYIGRQIRRLPVTVLGAYRTDEMTTDHRLARLLPKLVRERMVEELPLGPLARAETAQLAAGLLDGPAGAALTDWLQAMTEGNPLFSEHLLMALRDEGRLVWRPDGWQLLSSACPMPPPIVRTVVERRVGQLEPRTREALDMAAVLGQKAGQPVGNPGSQTFGLTLLTAALGVERAIAVAHLEALLDARLVRECEAGYRFEQPLLCEALYQGMSAHRRAALELRAAQASERLGNHGSNGTLVDAGVNGWLMQLPVPVGGLPPAERC